MSSFVLNCVFCGQPLSSTSFGPDGLCSTECREKFIKSRGCQGCGRKFDSKSGWLIGDFSSYSSSILHCPICVKFIPLYEKQIEEIDRGIQKIQASIRETQNELRALFDFELEIDEANKRILFQPDEGKSYSIDELQDIVKTLSDFDWSIFQDSVLKKRLDQLNLDLQKLQQERVSYPEFLRRMQH